MAQPPRDEGIIPGDRPPPRPLGSRLPDDPAPLPSLTRPREPGESGSGLQSLAQSARGKHLNSARWTLIVIGILTFIINLGQIFVYRGQVEAELRRQGANMIPLQLEAAMTIFYLIMGGFAMMGLIFVVLGILVKSYPIFCTVTGLVLYLIGFVVSSLMAPETIVQGIILKIIIVVGLAKAVQAALAYERERPDEAPSERYAH